MRGFAAIGLVNPKYRENVGSVLRAAGCYGAALVAIAGNRPDMYMGRICTDTQKTFRHIPTLRITDVFDVVPYDCVPIAVDLLPHAKCLFNFHHPSALSISSGRRTERSAQSSRIAANTRSKCRRATA